jgi:hypothetical protein
MRLPSRYLVMALHVTIFWSSNYVKKLICIVTDRDLPPGRNRIFVSRLPPSQFWDPANIFFKFLGVGWDWVHLVRRPLFGLLYQPRMIDNDESVAVGEWELAGETEVLGENMSQYHFVHTNPTWPGLGLNPGLRCGKPATNFLFKHNCGSFPEVKRQECESGQSPLSTLNAS